ncbi:hypothetical protein F5148DRAFT_1291014 [Russula earlei]|uniref:Uncharacterized protein n=1 Tax=Russula earlei TaxID=71964 RepID=A0ACC0TV01_9AGAM|nr:hypothetical protein F5148DRAFT_1291014 [Russula earlei]
MHFAKTAAANALIDGWKSVELCQTYILLSFYAVPARRWEEDRSWLYTSLAIRIATDLNLHILPPKKPTTDIDKSTATQFGKPSTLKEDFIVRKSLEWYKSSPNNHLYDVHIIAYTSLFRIVNKFHQDVFSDPTVPNSLNRSIDFRAVTLEHDRLLTNCRQEWAERFERDSDHSDAACESRVKLPFCTNYARLVMFSFGFQNAFQWGLEADDEVFFTRSLESAKTVVTVLVDSLVPTGYIRFAPDGYFVFAAFASAFTLKLLRPECSRFISPYQVIERLIATIGSPQIAIDERHTPKLTYASQGPPPQQMQTGSSTPRYQQPTQPSQPQPPQQQQQRQQQQPVSPPQNTTSSSLSSGVSSNAGTPDLHQSVPQHSGATAPPNFTNAVSTEGPGNYVLEQPPDFMFGVAGQPGDLMDFMFDKITTPGNDDLLATMQAIQNPTWWQNMMMPGFFWPAEEAIQDHMNMIGNGMNTYQNLQQPAEGLHA